MVSEPSLVADGDTARGQRLWAGQPEAPCGCLPLPLPRMGRLTGLAPQSCFSEKPKGPSAPWGTEARKLLGREQFLPLWVSRAHELRGGTHSWPMFPGAAQIFQDRFIPRPSHLGSRGPTAQRLCWTPRRAGPTVRTGRSGLEPEQHPVGLGILPRPRPPLRSWQLCGLAQASARAVCSGLGVGLPAMWGGRAGDGTWESPCPALGHRGGRALPSLSAVQFLGSALCGPLSPAEDQDEADCGLGTGISRRQFSRPWSGELPTGLPAKTQHLQSWMVRAQSQRTLGAWLCPCVRGSWGPGRRHRVLGLSRQAPGPKHIGHSSGLAQEVAKLPKPGHEPQAEAGLPPIPCSTYARDTTIYLAHSQP